MPIDFLTILGQVITGIFGPWLVIILTIVVVVIAFFFACFSGSEEAGWPWQITLASWIIFVIIALLGIAFLIFTFQFEPFAWVPYQSR